MGSLRNQSVQCGLPQSNNSSANDNSSARAMSKHLDERKGQAVARDDKIGGNLEPLSAGGSIFAESGGRGESR